jgi:thioredoxin-like negative regulator of GroEL
VFVIVILCTTVQLKIRTIPTVVIFIDGVAADKIIGFEGLADGQPEGKEDEWPTIRLARLLGSKGALDKKSIVDDDDVEKESTAKFEDMRKAFLSQNIDDDDLDFSD